MQPEFQKNPAGKLEVDLSRYSEGHWLFLIIFSGFLQLRYQSTDLSHSIGGNSSCDHVRNKKPFYFSRHCSISVHIKQMDNKYSSRRIAVERIHLYLFSYFAKESGFSLFAFFFPPPQPCTSVLNFHCWIKGIKEIPTEPYLNLLFSTC